MNDEHQKLVAKIQYFYDIMTNRLSKFEDLSLTGMPESDRSAFAEVATELNYLALEYSKTFENFLYKE